MVKTLVSFSNSEANAIQDIVPYIEIGHKNANQDMEDVLELMTHRSYPFFVDYPYFREVEQDGNYNEWNISSKGNVFDTLQEFFKPTELERKVPGGIYSKIIPVISRLKNHGSLKNIAAFYENLYLTGKKLGYFGLGFRLPVRMNTNFEASDIPVLLKLLSERDFLFLDLRGEIPSEKKEELVKNLKEIVLKINQINKEVNIIFLNTKVKTPSDLVLARKENIGDLLVKNTGVYGYGDYLFEPEKPGFNRNNMKRSFNLYYYDFLKNIDLTFLSEISYLNSLEKMKNDAYFYDLFKKHSIYCRSCRVLISILDSLPEIPPNFRELKVDLRQGHYLTDIYLELKGLKETLGRKE